eukprot:11185916-Lingulodinium_polyedra.AAC.1
MVAQADAAARPAEQLVNAPAVLSGSHGSDDGVVICAASLCWFRHVQTWWYFAFEREGLAAGEEDWLQSSVSGP